MGFVTVIDQIAAILKYLGILAILTVPLAAVGHFDFLEPVYPIAAVVFFIIDVVLIVMFIYAYMKGRHYKPHLRAGKPPVKQVLTLRNSYFKDRWRKLLEKYMVTPSDDSVRLAVIDADGLIDDLLKDLGFPGEHLSDRLAYLNSRDVKSLNALWDAHRLRNNIVHQSSFRISVGDAKKALRNYEAFLKEMKIL